MARIPYLNKLLNYIYESNIISSLLILSCFAGTIIAKHQIKQFTFDTTLTATHQKPIKPQQLVITPAGQKKKMVAILNSQSTKIVLMTKDGLKRHAVLRLRPNAKGNIVLAHPASCDKDFMIPFEEEVFTDYNCIRTDFRRHGENIENQFCTLGKDEVYEIQAAADVFKNNPKTKQLPLFGFGISMGGATLIEAESQNPIFDGLIIQSTFESIRKQIQRMYGFYRIPLMHNLIFRQPTLRIAKNLHRIKLYKVKPMFSIRTIKTPIFLIHAKNDPFIPLEAFERIKKEGKSCITKTWTPDDGKHTKLLETYPKKYMQHCNNFLDNLLTSINNKKKVVVQNTGNKHPSAKPLVLQKKQKAKRILTNDQHIVA